MLWFDVFGIEARWLLNNNPLHCTYFEMQHPDLLDNIQARTPVANIVAMVDAVRDFNRG